MLLFERSNRLRGCDPLLNAGQVAEPILHETMIGLGFLPLGSCSYKTRIGDMQSLFHRLQLRCKFVNTASFGFQGNFIGVAGSRRVGEPLFQGRDSCLAGFCFGFCGRNGLLQLSVVGGSQRFGLLQFLGRLL